MAAYAKNTPNIYFVGSHSVGKTTLARWCAERLDRPFITEVARQVLAEIEIPLDRMRVELDRIADFQTQVFLRQISAEKASPPFVADRGFCNLAYAAQHTLVIKQIESLPAYREYFRSLRDQIIFFVRPSPATLREDGVRAGVNLHEVLQIDAMVKLILEMHDLDYVHIGSESMQERARTVQSVLRYAGVLERGSDESTSGNGRSAEVPSRTRADVLESTPRS
ncbi:MAG: ATP-binding protein [Planctomycetota bacterium]